MENNYSFYKQKLQEIDLENFPEKQEPETPLGSNLEILTNFWTIPNVKYRNEIYTVDLRKQLLDNGNSKTQEKWAEYSRQAQKNNGFYTGDFPLYHAIFTTLYKSKDGNQKNRIEEIRQFIKQQMINKWLMTLTRIRYAPKNQKDKVIHNYDMPDQYAVEIDSFIGPDGFIKNTSNVKAPLHALLDTQQDTKEINSVYKWLTGADAYIWRLKSKVGNIDERVARFFAGSVSAYLNCNWNPQGSDSDLGVRARKN